MTSIDIHRWRHMPNISPVLKLVSMVLLLALRWEAGSVTFILRRKKFAKLLYVPKGHDEREMVPPPRHLFPVMMKILRRMGRVSAKNSDTAFNFSYVETGDERKSVISIDYGKGENVMGELESLLLKLYIDEEKKREMERIERERQTYKNQLIALAIFSIMALLGLSLFACFALLK